MTDKVSTLHRQAPDGEVLRSIREAHRHPQPAPADVRWRLLFPPSIASDPEAARAVADAALAYSSRRQNRRRSAAADARARKVAALRDEGNSLRQIARRLGVSLSTVKRDLR